MGFITMPPQHASVGLASGASCLAARNVHMIDIADLANGRESSSRLNPTNSPKAFSPAAYPASSAVAWPVPALARPGRHGPESIQCCEHFVPMGIARSGSGIPNQTEHHFRQQQSLQFEDHSARDVNLVPHRRI